MDPASDALFLGEHGEAFLRRLLWLLMALMGVLIVQSLWVYPQEYGRIGDKVGIALVALGGLVCMRRYSLLTALQGVLWGTWIVVGAGICTRLGLDNAAVLSYPLFVMLAGWLLGRRHVLLMTTATSLFIVALGVLEWMGHTPPGERAHPLVTALVLVAVLLIGALISVYVSANIRAHHRRAMELARTLELRVAERTAHLEQANAQLATTLETLQRAQHELVQSEKLASLGSLVAGVAHELNTPIGNAVTAASSLSHTVEVFAQQAREKSMQRSTITEFVSASTEMADLLLRSTQRAAELVASFKRVAVDRTSEHRRTFELRGVVDELLLTLGPTLKRSPWRIDMEVPAGIVMDSYPGPLEQVLSNLILNASKHAFAGRSSGTITVRAEAFGIGEDHATAEPWVRLQVVDDGCGMEPDVKRRIFEPFFTTKLGQGGSGLGLSIAHTIVGTVLGGSLGAESAPGRGAVFTAEMPCTAPVHAEPSDDISV
jgi:signal transduction histidine kinase